MKNLQGKFKKTLLSSALFSFSALFAADIATPQIGGANISLSPTVSYNAASLRVSSSSTNQTNVYQSGESISMDLSSMGDGLYHYQLSLDADASQSGKFRIINGAASIYNDEIATAEAEEEDRVNRSLADN